MTIALGCQHAVSTPRHDAATRQAAASSRVNTASKVIFVQTGKKKCVRVRTVGVFHGNEGWNLEARNPPGSLDLHIVTSVRLSYFWREFKKEICSSRFERLSRRLRGLPLERLGGTSPGMSLPADYYEEPKELAGSLLCLSTILEAHATKEQRKEFGGKRVTCLLSHAAGTRTDGVRS